MEELKNPQGFLSHGVIAKKVKLSEPTLIKFLKKNGKELDSGPVSPADQIEIYNIVMGNKRQEPPKEGGAADDKPTRKPLL
jgi:hypothetical protein